MTCEASQSIDQPAVSVSAGTVEFFVPNLREDCRFYLMSNGAQYPLIEATSNVISFPDYNLPSGLRLSLSSNSGEPEVRLSWTTTNASQPTVQYGLSSEHYISEFAAATTTYTADIMCAEPRG